MPDMLLELFPELYAEYIGGPKDGEKFGPLLPTRRPQRLLVPLAQPMATLAEMSPRIAADLPLYRMRTGSYVLCEQGHYHWLGED